MAHATLGEAPVRKTRGASIFAVFVLKETHVMKMRSVSRFAVLVLKEAHVMKIRNVSRIAVLALVLAALAMASAAVAAPKEYWRGRPDFAAGETRGYFVWQDDEGWHVRWTTKGGAHIFSGTATCDGEFMHFKSIGKEKNDLVRKDSNNRIKFDAKSEGAIDGFDFALSPSTQKITFDLKMDGKSAPLQEVRIGGKKERPNSMPFTIDRAAKTPAGGQPATTGTAATSPAPPPKTKK